MKALFAAIVLAFSFNAFAATETQLVVRDDYKGPGIWSVQTVSTLANPAPYFYLISLQDEQGNPVTGYCYNGDANQVVDIVKAMIAQAPEYLSLTSAGTIEKDVTSVGDPLMVRDLVITFNDGVEGPKATRYLLRPCDRKTKPISGNPNALEF